MYSIFLPFAAIVVDLCVAYIYFKVWSLMTVMFVKFFPIEQHDWWLGGLTTSLIALLPLFVIACFLCSGWARLKQVTVGQSFVLSNYPRSCLIFDQTMFVVKCEH